MDGGVRLCLSRSGQEEPGIQGRSDLPSCWHAIGAERGMRTRRELREFADVFAQWSGVPFRICWGEPPGASPNLVLVPLASDVWHVFCLTETETACWLHALSMQVRAAWRRATWQPPSLKQHTAGRARDAIAEGR
jgi:hypothetical protein